MEWQRTARKRYSDEDALKILREIDVHLHDVLEMMHRLLMKPGKTEFIRSDNGGEFVAQHLQDWLRKVGVRPIQICPGSPWENGYNERFNGILRQELLNTEWFHSVK